MNAVQQRMVATFAAFLVDVHEGKPVDEAKLRAALMTTAGRVLRGPTSHGKAAGEVLTALRTMAVGEAKVFPDTTERRVSARCAYAKATTGKQFRVEAISTGIRVERTA